MNKNTNTINPVHAMMKPMPEYLVENNHAIIRAAQEQEVYKMLAGYDHSMTVADIVNTYPMQKFPGWNENCHRWDGGAGMYSRRLISNTCKRLEEKGEIISTLLCGRRIYSLIIKNEGDM